MELKSCLYETRIMHHRLTPKRHRFAYKFFSFYLDLDEIDVLDKHIKLFSHNQFNAYSFYDKDHRLQQSGNIKESIHAFLQEHGIDLQGGRIMLLTYLRTFGYVFNPVSFYYCFNQQDRPIAVVAEIGNTFGELKFFLINQSDDQYRAFKKTETKFYYISPFTLLDDQLEFSLPVPDEHLQINIDTSRQGKSVILTTMTGHQVKLTDANLLKLSLKCPFVTLKTISLIHWHALLLLCKRVPYQEKVSNLNLQKDIYLIKH